MLDVGLSLCSPAALETVMPPWVPFWLLRSMVVTGKGIYAEPNANAPLNRGYDILPDQHTCQLLNTGAGSFF